MGYWLRFIFRSRILDVQIHRIRDVCARIRRIPVRRSLMIRNLRVLRSQDLRIPDRRSRRETVQPWPSRPL